MDEIIQYIIGFLIGGKNAATLSQRVGYRLQPSDYHKYNVVIKPSSFFDSGIYGTPLAMPHPPLKEMEGVPLLFGHPEIEQVGTTLVVSNDIIAASFFLLSRYEEMFHREARDEHGRFPGRESLAYRAGMLHRPLVDEYGRLLRHWLRMSGVDVAEPERRISKIWLTHDVDSPFFCQTMRQLVRETIKGIGWRQAWNSFRKAPSRDLYYTFPWLLACDNRLRQQLGEERVESLFFLKAGGEGQYDKPKYNLRSTKLKALISLLKQQGATVGLHGSYAAGLKPALLKAEKKKLEEATGTAIRYNRNHFLTQREPEDMDYLEAAGITDDFTMGYADVSGFRLGTCRPVRWINPVTRRLSSLTLHPLLVMECTLDEPKYMGLPYDEALAYCRQLIEAVKDVNGELVLLWHNTTVVENEAGIYHRRLYQQLLNDLQTI